jgi:hypothetical protein
MGRLLTAATWHRQCYSDTYIGDKWTHLEALLDIKTTINNFTYKLSGKSFGFVVQEIEICDIDY